MKLKNKTIFYLALLPAPWFCADFVPPSIMSGLSLLLVARIFRPLPAWFVAPAAIFLSYSLFKELGPRLVPESAVSFLNIMIAAKLAQKIRDFKTSLILGLLWTGSFALFNNTVYYLFYLAFYYALVVALLPQNPGQTFKARKISGQKKAWLNLAKLAPAVLALFFLFPRFHGFLPSANSRGGAGEIGYSKTINNSQTSELELSSKTAFYARTSKKIPARELYWRGRVHAKTDGYNWRPLAAPHEKAVPVVSHSDSLEYQMNYEQNLEGDLVLLDSPLRITASNARFYQDQAFNTFKTYRKDKKAILTAVSNTGARLNTTINSSKEEYLALPAFLPKAFKELSSQINGPDPASLVESFKKYLAQNNFQYSLSPGPMPTLGHFLKNKKGFCTHYASLLGTLLRHRGIPARLISGFQGGEYNEVGGYYTVRSNDAHAWVEYFHESSWIRVDPTAFVSPARIERGGQEFLTGAENSSWLRNNFLYSGLSRLKQNLDNFNYKLGAFLDSYDRESQKLLARKLKMDLKVFYVAGGLFLLFLALATWLLLNRRKKRPLAQEDLLFLKFEKRLAKKGILVEKSMSETQLEQLCRQHELPENFLVFLGLYQRIKYQQRSELASELKSVCKQLI